jgi:hypothetical protein
MVTPQRTNVEQWMKRVAIGLVGLGMGLASACSTGSDTTAPPTTTITKEAFLQQGNAICSEVNVQVKALADAVPAAAPTTYAEVADVMRAQSQLIAGGVAQLRALPQPPTDAAELASMYAEADQLVALANRMATAAGQGDKGEVQRVSEEGDALTATANPRLAAYGLAECAK